MRDIGLVTVVDQNGLVKFSMSGNIQATGHQLLLQKVLKAIAQSPLEDAFGKLAGLGLGKSFAGSKQIADMKMVLISGLQTIQDALSSEQTTNDDEALKLLTLEDVFVGSATPPGQRLVGFSDEKRVRTIFIQIGVVSRSGVSGSFKLPINDRTWHDTV